MMNILHKNHIKSHKDINELLIMTSIIYLLRDAKEIYGLYESLDHAYNSLLQFIYTRYKYHNMESISSCNIDVMISSFQIIEYHVNLVSNTYSLSADFYLYDSKRKIYTSDKISISDFISKLNGLKSDEQYTCDDLKIFLPIDDTEVRVVNNKESELKLKLKMLEEARVAETKKLEAFKSEMEPLVEQYNKKQTFVDTNIRRQKEDEKLRNEKYGKFLVDRNVFEIMEKEMISGSRVLDNVPELFVRSYNAFKKMRANEIFKQTDEEQFEYFLNNIEKSDYFSGNYNIIFDAPNFEELKKTNYIIETESEGSSSENSSCDSSSEDSNCDSSSEDSNDDVKLPLNSRVSFKEFPDDESVNTDEFVEMPYTIHKNAENANCPFPEESNVSLTNITSLAELANALDNSLDVDMLSDDDEDDDEQPSANLFELMDSLSRTCNRNI